MQEAKRVWNIKQNKKKIEKVWIPFSIFLALNIEDLIEELL